MRIECLKEIFVGLQKSIQEIKKEIKKMSDTVSMVKTELSWELS